MVRVTAEVVGHIGGRTMKAMKLNRSLNLDSTLGPVTFFAIALIGLFYVKWMPYYDRAFVAAAHHSIGQSILIGRAASPPSFSWNAALDYALTYGNAIWKAMVLGLLLGSGVQALLPADWVARVLGKAGLGAAVMGGLLAIPGMMCTCCAAPVVIGLRERQASPVAQSPSGWAIRSSIPPRLFSWASSWAGVG